MNQPPGPRLPLLAPEEAEQLAGQVGVPGPVAELNVFRVLLAHPKVAGALSRLILRLMAGEHLSHRLRELAIMRIAWKLGSVYEWTQHWQIALDLGVPAADLVGVRDWASQPGFSALDRAVLAATDQMLEGSRITPATWETCRHGLGDDRAMIELVLAIGLWAQVAGLLRSVEVPLEPGKQPWPPDGRSPQGEWR
jgi:alkylhydroperoxidase family enzyme